MRGPEGQGQVQGAGGADRELATGVEHGGEKSHSGSGRTSQGGATAQKKAAAALCAVGAGLTFVVDERLPERARRTPTPSTVSA